MSLGPLVPRDNDRSRGNRFATGDPAEFLRPISALYNALPRRNPPCASTSAFSSSVSGRSLAVVAGIFMAVAVASLRQTPIYEAMRHRCQQGRLESYDL